jgi:transposase
MSDRFDHKLEHTLESKADEPCDTGLVRRIEVITGTGRRRRWSEGEKARIIIESLKPGANVSEVARRNGVSPQQLFGRRRGVAQASSEAIDGVASRVADHIRPTGLASPDSTLTPKLAHPAR